MSWRDSRASGAHGHDLPLLHHDSLVREELKTLGIEQTHVCEYHRIGSRFHELFRQARRLRRHRIALRLFELLLLSGIGNWQPAKSCGNSEETAILIGPHWRG